MSGRINAEGLLVPDTWGNVFKFLNISDLYTVSRVCRLFREMVIDILRRSLDRPDSPLRKFIGSSWIDRKAMRDSMHLSEPFDVLHWSVAIHTLAIWKFFGISVSESGNPIFDFLQLEQKALALTGQGDVLAEAREECTCHIPCTNLPPQEQIVDTLRQEFKAIIPQSLMDLSFPEGNNLILIEANCAVPSDIIHCFAQIKLLLEDPLFDSLIYRDREEQNWRLSHLRLSQNVLNVFCDFLHELHPFLPTLLRIDVYREIITDLFVMLGKRFSERDFLTHHLMDMRSRIPSELREDRALILSVVKKEGFAICFSNLWGDAELFAEAVAQNPHVLTQMPEEVFDAIPQEQKERYKTVIIRAIEQDTSPTAFVFCHLPDSIQRDNAILLATARNPHNGGAALSVMPYEILKQRQDLVLAALRSGSQGDFNILPEEVCDPIIERQVIQQQWANTFVLWPQDRQQNRDCVLAYLKQNPQELREVPQQYWTDLEILRTIFSVNPDTLRDIVFAHTPTGDAVRSILDPSLIHSLILSNWRCALHLIGCQGWDAAIAKMAIEESLGQVFPAIVFKARSSGGPDIRSLAPDALRKDANLLPWALIANGINGINDFDKARQLVLLALEQAPLQRTTIHWFGQIPCMLRDDPEIKKAFQIYLETAAAHSDTLKL